VKLEICRQIFEKYTNIKFNENPSSGSRVVPCGRRDRETNRHEEANNSFSQILREDKQLFQNALIFASINMVTLPLEN